ncbi:MAG: hypothetical protein CML50_02500 [Rhodobacteraceae bacterium]|jgi:putative endonuclease|uniref:UPF0102 protein Ga0080559_TMP2460 n=1 Tax=Salipiger profundus TaxID=1229727 RepID=A0A1U7D5A5_9RHOB|nr:MULTISPECIES: YraN family protein [Salipiger]APX23256.1 putative endonuclease [Salipiger profundus]MAB04874.1 hypothetical protein [Paracoccaceae bacterium]GGA14304.1 UPF0102 protein [Salipiger profundus]SFD49057.1 putative endonuclease [Salipiger profundus]
MGEQLAFDFRAPAPPIPAVVLRPHEDGRRARQDRGALGYHAGLSAEAQVVQDYERRGYAVLRKRWRGACGEIDLILQDGDALIFVEVKKSRSFDRALARLSQRQIGRLLRAGEEFAGTQPRGSLTDMRFDIALVNASGVIRVMENALGP